MQDSQPGSGALSGENAEAQARWKEHGWKFTYRLFGRLISPFLTNAVLQQRWSEAMAIYIVDEGFFPPGWIEENTVQLGQFPSHFSSYAVSEEELAR